MDRLTLRAGDLTLELAPEYGGSVAAFRLATEQGPLDLLRPLTLDARHALYSGMFPMVPFANCIRDNSFGFEGATYRISPNMPGSPLNFHGSGWQLPWTVAEAAEGRGVLRLDDAVVDDVYRFDAEQVFTLDETGLAVDLTLTNRGARRMPFSFGQHPWFPRHGETQLRFAAGGFWTEEPDGAAGVLTEVAADRNYAAWRQPPLTRQNNCYAGWAGTVEIAWPERGIGLSMTADPVFPHLMFHVPASGEPVFCAEPQSNAPCGFDGLEAGKAQQGVHILEPGQACTGRIRFTPVFTPPAAASRSRTA